LLHHRPNAIIAYQINAQKKQWGSFHFQSLNKENIMRFGGLGGWEWIIILVIVIILFGGSKLAGVGSALGQSIREFREAVSSKDEDKDDSVTGKPV
jgi:sec-independent protein translocase protein TatA